MNGSARIDASTNGRTVVLGGTCYLGRVGPGGRGDSASVYVGKTNKQGEVQLEKFLDLSGGHWHLPPPVGALSSGFGHQELVDVAFAADTGRIAVLGYTEVSNLVSLQFVDSSEYFVAHVDLIGNQADFRAIDDHVYARVLTASHIVALRDGGTLVGGYLNGLWLRRFP